MRRVLAVALGIVALVFAVNAASNNFFEIEVEGKAYTVPEQCMSNALKLCADDTADHKAFQAFINHTTIITDVAKSTDLWEAGHNAFSTLSHAELMIRASAAPTNTIKVQAPTSVSRTLLAALPDSFDSRTRWPKCVGAVRNQGKCFTLFYR
jgi:hypothetical protein